jgi:cation/acetate symporter
MLVVFCAILTLAILERGLRKYPGEDGSTTKFSMRPTSEVLAAPGVEVVPEDAGWVGKPYVRTRQEGESTVRVWRVLAADGDNPERLASAQTLRVVDGTRWVNGAVQGRGPGQADFQPVGHVSRLPDDRLATGSLGPFEFFRTLSASEVVVWNSQSIAEGDGTTTTVYYPNPTAGHNVLVPGLSPTFQGLRASHFTWAKLDFLSLMLALFCGTASLPHILIRYYTVKDQEAVRRSTVVGIASIGFFYLMTLYLGYGAMVSHILDPTDSNMATPLLARSFGELPFAIISAIAFTTVLGTVSGLIIAASGAVAHDLMTMVFARTMSDHEKVRAGKVTAVAVGVIAMALGILCKDLNTGFLVGWAFNVAASANLAALVMALFWKGATRQGITASIGVGLCSSLGWILLSGDTFSKVYGWPASAAPVPFSQPAIVSIPLAFIVLIVVSVMTRKGRLAAA